MEPSRNRVNILCSKTTSESSRENLHKMKQKSQRKIILISNIHSVYLYILSCVVIDKAKQFSLSPLSELFLSYLLFLSSASFLLSRFYRFALLEKFIRSLRVDSAC